MDTKAQKDKLLKSVTICQLYIRYKSISGCVSLGRPRDPCCCHAVFFCIFSAAWVFLTLLPTLIQNSKKRDVPIGTREKVGWGIAILGLLLETISDYQKSQFKANPDNAVSYIFANLRYIFANLSSSDKYLILFLPNWSSHQKIGFFFFGEIWTEMQKLHFSWVPIASNIGFQYISLPFKFVCNLIFHTFGSLYTYLQVKNKKYLT